jgi:aryl-alcohol dehydrogenase-like predicted oxidoreductase
MDKRTLGKSDLKISPMGLGCWAIGGLSWAGDEPLGWGDVDDNESIQAIHAGLDLGINFIDTANVYGAGHSEKVIAKALKGKRQSVILTTKFGYLSDEVTKQSIGPDTSTESIYQQCEDSLRRLNTDYLDLYQFHINDFDPEKAIPVRETLENLVQEGKIRYYGWSTDFPDRAQVFAEAEHCVSMQFQCNVLDRNDEMISLCEKHQLSGINRGPLAMGLLSGKYNAKTTLGPDDNRGKSPEWLSYFKDGKPNETWLSKLEAIREILSSSGRSLVQGALAWLWAKSEVTIPIPGFKSSVKQVKENAKALEFGPLSEEYLQEIDSILGY